MRLTTQSLTANWPAVLAAVEVRLASQLRVAMPQIPYPCLLTLDFKKHHWDQYAFCREPSRVSHLEKLVKDLTGERMWSVHLRCDGGDRMAMAVSAPAFPDEGINNCSFKTERTIIHDELRFRSPAEIAIYKELKKRRLLFLPNPAVVMGGKKPEKREPDCLVFNRAKKCGILEVMGKKAHTNAVKDHERARLFQKFGIVCVQFFDADRCEQRPADVVDEFLAILARS